MQLVCRQWIVVLLISFSAVLAAQSLVNEDKNADKSIAILYDALKRQPSDGMTERLAFISHFFLGKPYLLGALGEGKSGQYDQFPLYRTDFFDCVTYVESVLAIAMAPTPEDFERCIRRVRYKNGLVSYATRNHFQSLDWNLNNQKQGFVKDITTSISAANGKPIYKNATALIDKPSYYQRLNDKNIRINGLSPKARAARVAEMRREGTAFQAEKASLPYLPLTALFEPSGKANHYLFNQIPNGAIIEIVRPNWDMTSIIGTHQNVSHLGFGFWHDKTLMFRDASFLKKAISNTPLIDYLRKYRDSPTIKGINIQVVVPQKPSSILCDNEA